jgi:hypothetical protein
MNKACFVVGSILFLITGCSQIASPTSLSSTKSPTPEAVEETPVMNEVPVPTPLDPSIEKIILHVKNDLSQRLAIDPEQIELVEAASVTWPDGGMGCPQPDMAYTQVQVDGVLIRLRANDQIYEYHSGGARGPFLCE